MENFKHLPEPFRIRVIEPVKEFLVSWTSDVKNQAWIHFIR